MSHEGKLQRGKDWYSQRDIEGKLPDGIKNDPNKMDDINYYLDSLKPKESIPKSNIPKAPAKRGKKYGSR